MDATPSLLEVFENAKLVDRRRAQGRRHPLHALLALTVVAMLTGIRSLQGTVEFGRAYGWPLLRQLGFRKRQGPSAATLSRVFRALDVVAFEASVHQWMLARLGARRFEHISLDGKSLRGSGDGELPAVHLLAAYASEVQTTLAQVRVEATPHEHQAALELLGILPLKGKVVTADAMFTHRDFCAKVREQGGDYVLPVKENQPTLHQDLQAVFQHPPAGLSPPTETTAGRQLRFGDLAGQGAWAD